MILHESPQILDRDFQPLNIGDRVRFIRRGFFLPREQESFGTIQEIDAFGGIRIRMCNSYKHFLSSKKVGDVDEDVYFTHHRYDRERHARVYSVMNGPHELFISLFECYQEAK